jgi:hypothetical protein
MKNLIKAIECSIHHCLYGFQSFDSKQARGTCHLLRAVIPQQSFVLLLLLLVVPIFSLVAQNQKAIKNYLQEDKIYYTPQLKGSNPMVKPATVNTSIRNLGEISSITSQVQQIEKTSSPMTWSQLMKQMGTKKNMLSDVTIYSGIGDQRSPQIASMGSEMFVAFENNDTQSGTYPYGTIDVYQSEDGGATWKYFHGFYNSSFPLILPQIVLVGTDVIVSYHSGGYLYTYRWVRSNGSVVKGSIPIPTVSADEYVVDHKMVTDAQEYTGTPYLYMAMLFRQADGKNKILFSTSGDTARTWNPFISLGRSESELNATSIGLDYSSSGLYLAYLGTDTLAGSIVIRKSISFGSTWSPEIILPMNVFGGANKKVGPMVAAYESRVAVIYQYDFTGNATYYKTGSDFDVYAIVSDDGGASWEERAVSSTNTNEILPNITSDLDGNFYVSFIRDGKMRVSTAGQEFAFGVPDSSSTSNASLDDFPSIYGSIISGANTAYTTWTEVTNSSGLDVYGAVAKLRIPPSSPSDLVVTVVSNSEVKLSWTDNSFDEVGFIIYYRQEGTGDSFTQKDVVGADVTSYSVTGLSASVRYEFYIRAFNANGFSLRTNIEIVIPGGGLTNGLVAYYPFNGNANDESGNGNNGTVNGATLIVDRFGKPGKAYNFDGISNEINIGNLGVINDQTISLWFKKQVDINYPSGTTSQRDLIGTQNSCNIVFKVGFHPSYVDKIFVMISDKGCSPNNDVEEVVTDSSITGLDWHHLVIIRSGINISIYKDGKLEGTFISGSNGNPGGPIATTNVTKIGRTGGVINENSFFNGSIDDIRIYNRALSTSEIDGFYHEGGWPIDTTPPGSPIGASTPNKWINQDVSLSWTNPSDPSGITALWYTFNSSPSISNLGTSINVTGLTTVSIPAPAYSAPGVHTLYFYLADGKGNKDYTTAVSVTFQYDNTPPVIDNISLSNVPVVFSNGGIVSGSPQINVTASDQTPGSGVEVILVGYRSVVDTQWIYSSPSYSNSINFSIPQSKFILNNKPIGVNFTIGVGDYAGNVKLSPFTSIDVKLGPQATDQPSFTMPAASGLSNKTTAYRMISVPYNLTNKQPANLLSSFGSHSENNVSYARWRFQRYVNNAYQDYDQFSTENAVTPGAAFFFIVRDQGSQLTVQGESIVRSDAMYNPGISLQSGWNLIGNPFTIPYPIDSLEFHSTVTLARAPIRQHAYYSGTGPISGWDTSSASVNKIQPWSGVALYVNSAGTLKFPSAGQRGELSKTSQVYSITPIEKAAAGNWTLAINAYRNDIDMRCEGSSLGMAQGAKEGDDPYDSYIPPIVGDKNVAVYFRNADGAMMRDIRPLNEEGGVWEMCVVTGDADARVKLQLGNKLNLPNPTFEAYLIDVDQKMAHNLKDVQSLEINSGNGTRNFRVVVGKKSFVEENNADVALAPSSMKLYANYPNPFNPETVIRYTVPNASASYTVTLKVFNVLGQEIATLVNEQKQAGYYEAKFNGVNQSSGVYFYRLSITDGNKTFQDIKKMVLMK